VPRAIRIPVVLRLFWKALMAWQSDHAPRLGAALAFYTLFALAPVLLVVIAIAGAVFGPEAVRGEIVGQLDSLIGAQGARTVQSVLEGASRPREGRLATIVGTVTFAMAATGAFLELQAALNAIWRVKPNPKPGINLRDFITRRLRSFGLVVSIGFLLLVSLAVSAALAALGDWLGRTAPNLPLLLATANTLVSLVVITALFAVLYRVLPDVQLRWRDVTIGAFTTAVLFTIGKQLIGIYIGRSTITSMFGAAGSVVVLLLWVYYSAQIVLLGAEFTRVYTEHREHRKPRPAPFAERDPDAAKKAT
jgi:membrane protein